MDTTAESRGDESGRDQGFFYGALAAAVLDDSGEVVRWSGEAARLLGRGGDEVCGHAFRELLADAPGDGPYDAVPASGRARLRSATGTEVAVDLYVTPLAGGDGGHLVLAAPAATALEWGQGVSLLRGLFRQHQLGFAVHDTDLRVVHTNITPEMFGVGSVAPGGRVDTVVCAEDAAAIEAVLGRVLETGIPIVGHEQRIRNAHGPEHSWVLSLSAFRLENARGEPSGVAAVIDDVTEQERLRRHRDLLHYSAARLGFSLDMVRTAQALAEVVVPGLGDLATVDLARPVLIGDEPTMALGGGESSLVRIAASYAGGDWPDGLLPVGGRYPALPDSPELRGIQQGESVVMDRRSVARALGDGPLTKLLVPEGGHSLVVCPLFARGLMLGTVTAWRTRQPDPFDADEVELLAEISSRAALGIDNSRRYTREHRAAMALQERLLPRAVTDTPAAETVGIYRPAAGGAGVSGDWFDVITLPSLRVALVVGDVVGHGLPATATMGRLRTAIQTFADLELDPAEVLAHVEDLVQRLAAETPAGHRDTVGATCLYAVYDPTSGRCTFASAGQPPPILVLPDGTTRVVEVSPGPPLGVGGVPFESTTIDVEPGSVIALYTDGLFGIERYAADTGLRRLRDELAEHCRSGRPLDDIGPTLLSDTDDRPPRDDIALLLARTRAVAETNIASWEFPADLSAVAQAREATTRQLTAWRLEELAFTTELVVSELITNAIRYAGGPVSLRLIRDQVLICEVADPSNTQPRLLRAEATDEGGRGLFIVAQCTTRWGCRYGRQGKTIWTEQPLGHRADGLAPLLDIA